MSDSNDSIGSKDLRIAVAIVLGVLGGLTVVWLLFRWGRGGPKPIDDVELGSSPSHTQRPEDRSTNRYDDSRNDTALPAYRNRETSEIPSLFRLSSSIASLKLSDQGLATSPYHLILFERVSKLQVMIKEMQQLLYAAPPEGYEPQSKEEREVSDLKKKMSDLVGTPEPVTETQIPPTPEAPQEDKTPSISIFKASDPASSNEDASRHQRLVQIHSLLTLLNNNPSKSAEPHDSTFEELSTAIEALLHSLDSVPIPPATPSNAGEDDTDSTDHIQRGGGVEINPPPFSTHSQPTSSREELPPYQ